ncbi:MAG: restriction endonuclease [Selenomonadaceae bacterium]|nr:restriction endonuclease [Selenomonadaceae bacterium]MBR1858787.1 restriction endonuclease [Selenomonadaceae bacterium]
MKKAGLIDSPKRAHLQITECGRQLLSENVIITDKLLSERFPYFAKFKYGDKEAGISNESIINNETPQELFDRSYQEITAELSDELLTAVLNMSPEFFERLVVKLMEAMGYGGYEGAGFVTKSSGDGGIDGVIYEDKLGFNLIYIQAKRWTPDTIISRPEIQKFMGALAGPPKIEKGLYITTAKFSKEAKNYADAQHIILVDGKKLTKLMIEFDVGVSTQKIYKIKRVDNDFFTEQ